jgi:hypothetical protein
MWLLGETWTMEEKVADKKRRQEGALVEAKETQTSLEEKGQMLDTNRQHRRHYN